jgi:hypothetical protein
MIRVSAFRFFLTVPGTPWWIVAVLGAAVITGAATLMQDAREVDSALALVLLLQMYASATGFNATAARGYFDPLVVAKGRRCSVAAANLAAASLPGVVAWLTVLTVAALSGGGDRALAPQRQVALLIVSSVAWAAGVVLGAPGIRSRARHDLGPHGARPIGARRPERCARGERRLRHLPISASG